MKFDVEWLDAPGVRDTVLAATWARLRIEAGGQDLTELVHLASDSRRVGVYGPIFPLVEWFIENWWNILYEPPPTSPLRPGRGAPTWKREWVQRHNLLAAREGTALPDATFVRDGDDILVGWFPDPREHTPSRVRFVSQGAARVPASQFETTAAALVESTLQRLTALVGDNEDLDRALAGWTAIQSATPDERGLCRSLALLGLDPYDPDDATEALETLLESLSAELPATLLRDLLEGARPKTLEQAAAWLTQARASLANSSARHAYATLPLTWTSSAHQAGYQLARDTRTMLLGLSGTEAIDDLPGLMVDRLGWDSEPLRYADPVVALDGLVGLSKDSEQPVVVLPPARSDAAKRFLLARSAFFTVTGSVDQGRLLTTAATRAQRAARAFAAELLAPASAIGARVGGLVSQDEVAELSQAFQVSPLLIEHQLENHGLGAVAA